MSSLAYRLSAPVFMTGLLIMSLLVGCRQNIDSVLAAADSKMEEHPDSVLMLLSEYTPSAASRADSAYYALLLTHARYKNFIDETNDSLISVAVDWFLDKGDGEKASRALFLQGMIRMNANRLGEAAVSFSKGLDMARDSKSFMWEGQCARGLYLLYEKLLDGSSQVSYARLSYNAFVKSGDKGWIDYSKLELARALHNNFKYEESLSLLNQLESEENSSRDEQLLSEIAQLKALSMFALGKYKKSADFYAAAYELNPSVLNNNDMRNLRIALNEAYGDSVPSGFDWLIDKVSLMNSSEDAFDVLISKGMYREACESLLRYKNSQDSVLAIIFRNNVFEAVSQYGLAKEDLDRKNNMNERLSYWIVILTGFIIGILVFWRLRERFLRQKAEHLKIEADMESLRSDLLSQLNDARLEHSDSLKTSTGSKSEDFISIIRQHYADVNKLCDDFYQGRYSRNNGIHEEIDGILGVFREVTGLDAIGEYVDEKSGGLYSSFKKDLFNLSGDNQRLFLYVMLGFSARTISVILDQNVDMVYNKKSRLKSKILKSGVPYIEKYLKFF